MSLPIDGSEDRDLSVKGLEGCLEIGDWKRVLPGTDSGDEFSSSVLPKKRRKSRGKKTLVAAEATGTGMAAKTLRATTGLGSSLEQVTQRLEAEVFEMGLEGDYDERVDYVEAL